MEYISAEEFLKQPKEVQEVFIDWWEPSIGDLFRWNTGIHDNDAHIANCCMSDNTVVMTKKNKGINEGDRIPLLTEGQLRKFIEDKTGYKIELSYYEDSGYDLSLTDGRTNYSTYVDLGHNLLQAYWKVACEIAKEELSHDKARAES